MTSRSWRWVLASALLLVACGGEDSTDVEPSLQSESSEAGQARRESVLDAVGVPTGRYEDDALWLCRGRVEDELCTADLDTTVVAADGTTTRESRSAASEPGADCFYVYPTVDLRPERANASIEDRVAEEKITRAQAAQFSTVCRVFAPLYEQATIGVYDFSSETPFSWEDPALDVAYAQVLDAFRFYMANDNDGHPFVLLGHSQGAHHLLRLLDEVVDDSEDLSDQLVVAVIAGAGGYALNTPVGGDSGRSEEVPPCEDAEQVGCLMGFTSYDTASPPPMPGWATAPAEREQVCTNPALQANGTRNTSASTFPYPEAPYGTQLGGIPLDIDTEFVTYPDAFEVECVNKGSARWLAVTQLGSDGRPALPTRSGPVDVAGLGLHHLDLNITSDDLITLVERKTANL